MPNARSGDRQPVAVVTGGGGGIGAAVAEELGRRGCHVVTVDPLVTLDGAEQLPAPTDTTAGRIVAAGGSAQATPISVTDADAVRELFAILGRERGGVDAVVNVAGITRPTSFAKGDEQDWRAVLEVHLDGYLNVLDAALPLMAEAGGGRILGVTSGSGWRPADAGAYACAERAVAALTWQLGAVAPAGVVVNAVSPIAVTRMVTAAPARARPAKDPSKGSPTGGLSLGSMPEPEQLGPLCAHLVGEGLTWCRGQVVFAGGSEAAVVDRPRLLEVVRTDGAVSLRSVLEAVVAGAFVPAEAGQASGGGSNPRFPAIFDAAPSAAGAAAADVATCAVVTDRPDVGAALTSALEARGVRTTTVDAGVASGGFAAAGGALASAAAALGSLDGVVVALADPSDSAASGWEQVLAAHRGLSGRIHLDAGWARAAADQAAQADRPLRLAVLTDAADAGGRSRAQASAQLSRAAHGATRDRVTACALSVEARDADTTRAAAELAAHLLCGPEGPALSGAELAVGAGWLGLRSHPRPGGSVTYGGPAVPGWFDDALRAITGAPPEEAR